MCFSAGGPSQIARVMVSINIVWFQPAYVRRSHLGLLYGLEQISVYINLFIKAFPFCVTI